MIFYTKAQTKKEKEEEKIFTNLIKQIKQVNIDEIEMINRMYKTVRGGKIAGSGGSIMANKLSKEITDTINKAAIILV